jgi:phosphoglycolate phosphatase-like HAD superfamily hydrolase
VDDEQAKTKEQQRNAEEQAHFEEVSALRLRTLRTIEAQIERQGGEAYAQSHLLNQRTELQYQLGIVEKAASSAASGVSEDLGPSGRFAVYYKQNEEIQAAVRLLGRRLDEFIAGSLEWRSMHRQWIFIIGFVVVMILLILVAVITWLAARGS